MSEYKPLETSQLLDMLAKLTAEYTHMLGNNDRSEKFYDHEVRIHFIQEEINSRTTASGAAEQQDVAPHPHLN